MYTTGTLLRRTEVSPHMLRLTFAVPGCRPTERPDDWLMLFFGEPGDHSLRRNYTVRAVRPEVEELDIDFALHEGGLAATWARTAEPGDELVWSAAEGGYVLPEDAEWQLLVGDLTALPAIGRMLAQARPGVQTTVVLEIEDPADRQDWETDADVRWLHGTCCLNEIVRTFPEPDGPGYIWMAGQTQIVRDARRYLRHERGVDKARYSLTGYWMPRSEEWLERYKPHAEELSAIWERGEAEGLDEEELMDEYEAALERAGL
ncbi:siderophore-interacting protein [Solirubrobacter sp. CPCC 204708]|uniref:Siderophore-interacting protein n=1 Tax=Solirubrobacter deserti TaxID=2282478 RepID=A0ABT4RBN7_9ACTN|nr:siderophore-interacting protein [Solirubrobacter deserti]MBE2317163.1 siderophore-interacting protein [Solirubrobacter deserti]MDA0135944.1 siderophore-interacting protein [Solirubrobacter deserti]